LIEFLIDARNASGDPTVRGEASLAIWISLRRLARGFIFASDLFARRGTHRD
jgi:hypothetical protein